MPIKRTLLFNVILMIILLNLLLLVSLSSISMNSIEEHVDPPKEHRQIESFEILLKKNVRIQRIGQSQSSVILLLHTSLSSNEQIQSTLQQLFSWGYRSIAVDLTNFQNETLDVKWLEDLWQNLRISKVSIVTFDLIFPSLLEYPQIFSFIFITPRQCDRWRMTTFVDVQRIRVPTLIIHDNRRISSHSIIEYLRYIPTSECLLVDNISLLHNDEHLSKRLRTFLVENQPVDVDRVI